MQDKNLRQHLSLASAYLFLFTYQNLLKRLEPTHGGIDDVPHDMDVVLRRTTDGMRTIRERFNGLESHLQRPGAQVVQEGLGFTDEFNVSPVLQTTVVRCQLSV